MGFESSVKAGKDSKAGKGSVTKKLTDEGFYFHAKQAFDLGKFNASLEGFQKLLNKYPKSKNADNAQFWIGEIHYQEKWSRRSQ